MMARGLENGLETMTSSLLGDTAGSMASHIVSDAGTGLMFGLLNATAAGGGIAASAATAAGGIAGAMEGLGAFWAARSRAGGGRPVRRGGRDRGVLREAGPGLPGLCKEPIRPGDAGAAGHAAAGHHPGGGGRRGVPGGHARPGGGPERAGEADGSGLYRHPQGWNPGAEGVAGGADQAEGRGGNRAGAGGRLRAHRLLPGLPGERQGAAGAGCSEHRDGRWGKNQQLPGQRPTGAAGGAAGPVPGAGGQYGATDSEEMQRKIGAKMGALLAEAQIIAANEYNASEGAQLMQESNLALVQGIRDDSVLQRVLQRRVHDGKVQPGHPGGQDGERLLPVDISLAPEGRGPESARQHRSRKTMRSHRHTR